MVNLGLPPSALDGLDYEQSKAVLLDVARTDNPTLSMVGAEPASAPIYVLDLQSTLLVGSHRSTLVAYARSNSLDISEPALTAGEDAIDGMSWEIRLLAGGTDAGPLSTGATPEAAEASALLKLAELCGGQVMPLQEWAALATSAGFLETLARPAAEPTKRAAPFATVERADLPMLPISAAHLAATDSGPRKVRRKEAFAALEEPQGLDLRQDANTPAVNLVRWNIAVTSYEGKRLANHHDLLGAVRMGLDVSDIQPWPNDVAHRFLLGEELRRTMRRRGYVELTDFDPSTWVTLRTSLPEFSAAVTGDVETSKAVEPDIERPAWPPSTLANQAVVIVLDHARLARAQEPEWERVVKRDIVVCASRYWVEEHSVADKASGFKRAAGKSKANCLPA